MRARKLKEFAGIRGRQREALRPGAVAASAERVPNVQGQLPLPALRDLLGLVRVMYADAVASHASAVELEELRAIGESLHTALDLAAKTKPNTMGHRAAWSRAEQATRDLGALVGKYSSLQSTVRTAGERVVGAPAVQRPDPNAKVRERTKRG